MSFIDEYLTAWVGERFVTSLRVRLFAHLQRLSVGWFERRQVGDLISRLTGDIATIEQLVLTGVNLALTYAFQVVFFAGAMFLSELAPDADLPHRRARVPVVVPRVLPSYPGGIA